MASIADDPITWERLRAIFGNPHPVLEVTERQFDYSDDKLREMARTPYNQFDFKDLCYYHHDLANVQLQPELFRYLFPVCLMDWHRTLLENKECSHGDSEFHFGVVVGKVLEKMLSEQQRVEVERVFLDSMLFRMDQERGFVDRASRTPAFGWIYRLNSLALVMESYSDLWHAWWHVETPGRAVCLLQYCSGLMYFDGENPLFKPWNQINGGGGPYLWESDAREVDCECLRGNIQFLRENLNYDRVIDSVHAAADMLKSEPEAEISARIASELDDRRELIESRVEELPRLLSSSETGWEI